MVSIIKLAALGLTLLRLRGVSAAPQLYGPWNDKDYWKSGDPSKLGVTLATLTLPVDEQVEPTNIRQRAPSSLCTYCGFPDEYFTTRTSTMTDKSTATPYVEEEKRSVATTPAPTAWGGGDGAAFGVPPPAVDPSKIKYHGVPNEPEPKPNRPITVMVHGHPSVLGSSGQHDRRAPSRPAYWKPSPLDQAQSAAAVSTASFGTSMVTVIRTTTIEIDNHTVTATTTIKSVVPATATLPAE